MHLATFPTSPSTPVAVASTGTTFVLPLFWASAALFSQRNIMLLVLLVALASGVSALAIQTSIPDTLHAANGVILQNDYLVFGGGYLGNQFPLAAAAAVYVIDLRTNQLVCSTTLSQGRFYTSMSVVNERFVFFMGGDTTGFFNLSDVVDVIDTQLCTRVNSTFSQRGRSGALGETFRSSTTAYASELFVNATTGYDHVAMLGLSSGGALVETPTTTASSPTPMRIGYATASLATSSYTWHIWAGGADYTGKVVGTLGIYSETQGVTLDTQQAPSLSGFQSGIHMTLLGTTAFVLVEGVTGLPVVDVFSFVIYAPYIQKTRSVAIGRSRLFGNIARLGPYIYLVGGYTTQGAWVTAVDIIDTRDWSVFVGAENLTLSGPNVLVGATTLAIYVFGFFQNASVVNYFTCGNSQVEAQEACDVHITPCAKNCTTNVTVH